MALLLTLVRPRRARTDRPAAAQLPASVTTDVAALYREPAAGSEILENLKRGARVKILSDRGRWLLVRTDRDRDGFLLEETVETDSDRDARQKRTARILAFPAVFGVVAEETDVLLAPFPLAPRAGRLRQGENIAIHTVDHDYYAFRAADGGIAFVRSADVDLVMPDPRQPAIVPASDRAVKDLKVNDLSPAEAPGPESETTDPGAESGVRSAAEQTPATLVSKVDPRYPEAARQAGVEGTVVLDATIDERGRVTDLQVVRGLPLGLSEAAVDAVSRWEYRAALGKNGPVVSHKTVRVVFQLGQ